MTLGGLGPWLVTGFEFRFRLQKKHQTTTGRRRRLVVVNFKNNTFKNVYVLKSQHPCGIAKEIAIVSGAFCHSLRGVSP
jgi:hypothetical protein